MEMTEQHTYRKTMAWVGFAYFVFLVLTLGLQSLAGWAVSSWAPQWMERDWFMWVLSYVPLYGGAFPAFLLVMHRLPNAAAAPASPQKLTVGRFVLLVVFCMGITYLLNTLSTLLSLGLAALKGSAVQNPLAAMQAGSGALYNFLFGCIVAPLGEELVFRWLLFKKIGAWGERQYVLLGGFLFALYHMNIFQIPYAFVLGALFCYLYCKTRRLGITIALHMVINTIGVMVGPLAAQNTVTLAVYLGLMLAAIAAAVVLLFRWHRRTEYAQGALPLPANPAREALCNVGMLAYILGCTIVTVLTAVM